MTYRSIHHYAVAATVAGGVGEPYEKSGRNSKVAAAMMRLPLRSVIGTIDYRPHWQAAIPYTDDNNGPHSGMPHLFYQLQRTAMSEHRTLPAAKPRIVGCKV